MASSSNLWQKKKPGVQNNGKGSSLLLSNSTDNDFTIYLSDDDDDDFKPTKSKPKPKLDSLGKSVKNETDILGKGSNINKNLLHTVIEGDLIFESLDEKKSPGIAKKNLKVEDDIAILFSAKCEAFSEGKSSWKNLMEKMQQNQKKDPAVVARSKIVKKRKTIVSKRGRLLSPQSKASLSKVVRSPAKKSPRLDQSEETGASCSKREQKQQIPDESEPEVVVCEDVTAKNEEITTERKAFADTNGSSSSSKELSCTNTTAKLASIFLSASERKALLSSKVGCDTQPTNDFMPSKSLSSKYNATRTTFPENPQHFSGNTVLLNDSVVDKDPYDGNKTKVCPFYKKLPGVPFCVDAFNYGLIPGMEVYFLSHFHSDHYIGLSKKFCKTVVCSYPTGNLVRMKLYVEDKCIRKLSLDKPYIICDSEVTLINANHCPGSVMFIFRLKNGQTILHTGDFRYTSDMFDNPSLIGLGVGTLYLDTTYCSPEYDFPTQCDSVSTIITSVKQKLDYRPKTLILCGSYLIGKERVYFTLAEAIGSKVFVNYDKKRIINAMEYPEFSSMISVDEASCKVHVVPMFSITAKNLQEYLSNHSQYTNIIGIKPSGWQFSSAGTGCSVKSHYGDTVTIIGVPYSEHSSFSELKEFVTKLKPKRVQPTVNVGNPKKRGDMMDHIEKWMSD